MTSQLYAAIIAIRRYSFVLTCLLLMLLTMLPVTFILIFVDWRYDPIWDNILWQSSLQNGSFWLLPGHVIFQDDKQIGGEEEALFATSMLVAIFLVPVVITIAFSYRMTAFIAKQIIWHKVRITTPTVSGKVQEGSLLAQLLPDIMDENFYESSNDCSVGLTGRSVVIRMSSASSLPPLFFDSTSNDIAKREGRRVMFNRDEEVVLDGITLEHFHIYAHHEYHTALSHFLTVDTLAVIVKELDEAEFIFEDDTLTAVFDIRSVKGENDLRLLFESLERLRELFDQVDADSYGNKLPRTKAVDDVIRFFGVSIVKKVWVQVMMILAVGLYITTAAAAEGKGLTGDLLMPLWLAGSFQLIGIHRMLKHKISLHRPKGIFAMEMNGVWSIPKGLYR